jgi:hypothetical protein
VSSAFSVDAGEAEGWVLAAARTADQIANANRRPGIDVFRARGADQARQFIRLSRRANRIVN